MIVVRLFLILLGVAFCLAGIAGGLYVWGYQGWVLGIVGIIEAAKCDPVNSWGVAWGVLRIILAGVAGAITFWIGWALGLASFAGAAATAD